MAAGRAFYVEKSNQSLTIKDSDPTSLNPEGIAAGITGGIITGGVGDRGGCAYVNGTMTMTGGTIYNCLAKRGGDYDGKEVDGVYNEYDPIHVYTDGCGGAVYVNDGSFVLNGGSIKNCSTEITTIGSTEKITIGDNTYDGINVRGCGGAVYVFNGYFEMISGTIENCKASYGGAVYVHEESNEFKMEGGRIAYNKVDPIGDEGGDVNCGCGVYTSGLFNMTGGVITNNIPGDIYDFSSVAEIYNNKSYKRGIRGGGVYVSAGNFNMSGGEISGNVASSGGGVLALGGTLTMSNSSAIIKDNYAIGNNAGYGGGVYINGCKFTITNGTISGNKALNVGGGICVDDNATLTFDGSCVITDNKAKNGGGFSLAGTSVITIDNTGVSINNNEAVRENNEGGNGGGIYLTLGTLNVSNGTIEKNKADNMGGGIYIGNGTLNIKGSVNINNNTALNGGGISLNNGVATIVGGNITQNNAGKYGGGLFLYNTDNDNQRDITFDGGTFSKNTATSGGGGVSIIGNLNVKMNATIIDNTANNGAGIYMGCISRETTVGPKMTFGDGLIGDNKAIRSDNTNVVDPTTAYEGYSETLSGVGGGVFLGNYSTLNFDPGEQGFGLYNNKADVGADDIFANGTGTNITLPKVSNMSLKNYNGSATELYWVEDYIKNDTKYDQGTKLKTNWDDDKTNSRYRQAQSFSDIYRLTDDYIDNSGYNGKYICLALGSNVVFVKLTKVGLLYNDDAKISISYKNADNVFKHYTDVFFTGIENNADVTKTVALPAGKYKFEEDTKWAWRYVDSPTFNPEHTDGYIEISSEKNREITIKNEVKSGYEQGKILEHSHRKVNRMKP